MKLLPTFLFILLSTGIFSQQQTPISIFGSVSDETNNTPLPYVNVILEGTNRGTVTNELGEFVLKIDSLPVRLVISHVGYDRLEMVVNSSDNPTQVALKTSTLQSVTVTQRRANRNKKILEKALNRVRRQSTKNHYGRAFYRQLSTNDSVYNELYEIFFDARFNADGINDWEIEQGRYALLERTMGERFVFNKNFTLINRVFPTMDPGTEKYISPIRLDGLDFYEIEMTSSFIDADEREIAVVAFTPKPEAIGNTPAMAGAFFIDLKTYDILKISGYFQNDNLRIVELQGAGKFEDYELHYECAFKPNDKGDLLVDYIKVNQTSNVTYENAPSRKLETNSLLTFYEYYTPDKKKRRLGGRVKFNKSDIDRINRVDYDPEFWKENPIVKRTPIEEQVIETFERDRQFGSIYLNNKNQVAFLPELDDDPVVKTITQKMPRNIPVHDKVYLHIDKPYYARGETLWFKAYITDAVHHRPSFQSRSMFVELINPLGEEVDSRKLEVLGSGFAQGDFLIYPGYLSGKYQIRAYTNQMLNYSKDYFFKKEIEVYTGLQPEKVEAKPLDIDLQFFPEGGNLVYGIPSQVAFKAIDQNGQPRAVTGTIFDQHGNKVTTFETVHQGMGNFVLKPETGKTYYAVANDGFVEKKVHIIDPLEEGYVMSIRNLPGKNISVRILCSPSLNNSEVYLIGQMRRHVYYKSKGTLNRQLLTFEVPKRMLPNGILHLTLMDSLHRPFCERLAFIDRENHLDLEIKPNKKKYNRLSDIELDFRLLDGFGDPVRAEMSVAVTDAGQINLPAHDQNIRNYLLLSSDLKGHIENPEMYFDPEVTNAHILLDLVMLCNGWSRFTWQEVLKKSSSIKVPKNGFDVCGKMREEDFEIFGRTVLTMIPFGGTDGFYTATVSQHGEFCFSNVNFKDTTTLVIQAIDDEGEHHEVSVEMYRGNRIKNNHLAPEFLAPDEMTTSFLNYNELRLQDELYFDGKVISLDEVTVTAKKKEPQKRGYRTFHGNADYVVEFDEYSSSLANELRAKVPGIRIINQGFRTLVQFTGTTGEPLILLDGIPMNIQPNTAPIGFLGNQNNAPQNNPNGGNANNNPNANPFANNDADLGAFDVVSSIPASQIDRVEVLKGPSAAIYGMRGMNGVLAIYSKENFDEAAPLKTHTYEGYYSAREFYVPKYESKERRDLRSTLFWEPSIMTDKNGKASISFPNSDLARSFNVVVEGITAEGRPVTGTYLHSWEEQK